jgi:hypothetical protein
MISLKVVETDLWLFSPRSHDAQLGTFCPDGSMIEKTLVDMTDLFDVKSTERQLARLGSDAASGRLKDLKRIEQIQDGAVIDRQRGRFSREPRSAARSSLKKRKPIWIEKAASVGQQA